MAWPRASVSHPLVCWVSFWKPSAWAFWTLFGRLLTISVKTASSFQTIYTTNFCDRRENKVPPAIASPALHGEDLQPHKHTNLLSQETSPYLLQHQHNPVDWYPWGEKAFEAARRENKPIFLSVGYSTCYWCHVMERQSFEVESIAHEMNQRFINIKVDREERPDVDQLYMTAVQILTRHGGWPMSVFLTPDLRPFYGGTYFPPTDQHGRPGFVPLIRALEDAYKNRRNKAVQSASQTSEMLNQLA